MIGPRILRNPPRLLSTDRRKRHKIYMCVLWISGLVCRSGNIVHGLRVFVCSFFGFFFATFTIYCVFCL